jgi:hypothetical protein
MKTGKVVIEGTPEIVEAIATQMRECFDVTYQSKTSPITLAIGKVRCWLQVSPILPLKEQPDDQKPERS